jgi:2',3'-cyclic-nucleotide 2'-phosphodiesterase (5'-nucleotidase family)
MGGTLARASVLLQMLRQANPNTALVFAGDLLSPSLASYYTHGSHMIDAMNALKPMVATLGNHEFDFGSENMERQIGRSTFPWLAANLVVPQGTPTHVKPWYLGTINQKRILFYGLLTESTNVGSKINQGYRVLPAIAYAKGHLPLLVKQLKPDVVVALTHLDLEQDIALAKAVPDIDVILGGHDHDQLLEVIHVKRGRHSKHIPILKMDSDAKSLGRLQLQLPSETPKTRPYAISWQYQAYALLNTPVDKQLQNDIEKQLSPTLQGLKTHVGQSLVALDARRQAIRYEETPLGNLIADAQRTFTQSDIALFNGGAVRSEQYYPPQSYTWADLLEMLPFGNTIAKVQGDGKLLRSILEHSVSHRPQEPLWGGWLHLSGMKVTYDLTKPVGHRVMHMQWLPDTKHTANQNIEPDTPVNISLSSYMLEGGNGYAMLKAFAQTHPKHITYFKADDALVLKTYLEAHPEGVSPTVEGRVCIHTP